MINVRRVVAELRRSGDALTRVTIMALALSGCSGVSVVNTLAPNRSFVLEADVAYGPLARQQLDIYRPSQAGADRPVVVFFYGGAWQRGERRDYQFIAEAFASKGIVAVLPDYRVYPEAVFPAFVSDGAAAVRWVRDHIEEYGGDPCRVFLSGHSAGAHIAALLTYDESHLAAAPEFRPAGLIGIAGPYDFLPLGSETLRQVFPAATRNDSQPINFVDGDEPPALLLHGTDDDTVLLRNSRRLAAKIEASGGSVQLREYDGVGHVRIILAMGKAFRWLADTRADATRFILEGSSACSAAER